MCRVLSETFSRKLLNKIIANKCNAVILFSVYSNFNAQQWF